MAQFTSAERINAAFKQVFRILGTSNTDDALGKRWYEELYSSVGTILPRHQWSQADEITFCSSLAQAQTLAFTKPAIVEDRSQVGTIITLTLDATSNGRLWIARDTPGDENSAILGDWIQPNDFPNAAGQPSNGFSCVLLDGANNVITATEGAWVPFYPLGCIVLANGQGVGQGELAAYVAPLKVAVFRYIGLKGGAAPVAPSAASFVRDEDPVINFDGQTDFDLDWSSAPDSLEVSLNGKLCTAGVDYTLVGRHVTWLDPFNPDLGVNVPLKTTDWLNFWYVNGATRRGITHHAPLPVLVPGQTVFTLPTAPLQNQHIQLYLNGQRCRQGVWYDIVGGTVTWLNPVVFFAPLGLTLLPTDVLTAAYIETADQGESTVKRPILPVTADGQTVFAVPVPDDPDSAKLYVNGQFQTLGTDWQWNTPTQIQWLDPFNPAIGLPITLVMTDEVQFIADNVGARCCGAQKFLELEDVPPDYVGQAGRMLTVNATEDGVSFEPLPYIPDEFVDLADVPASYTGEAGKIVSVKGDETGLEFVAPTPIFKVRAVIDPTVGGGDYQTIASALLAGVDKMELRPGKVFAESVIIDRGDVDILGYPNSIVIPPPGSAAAFILDASLGELERLRFSGFMVQMNSGHPNNFSAFRSALGNIKHIKFKDLFLIGYHYYPALPIDVSCGIDFANGVAPIEDVEVTGVLFQDWEYSCFTMWGAGGVKDVRVHTCRLLDYRTFGMDWYNGCEQIMINNNNFRTRYVSTPIVIVDGQTKSLFINGDAKHITFNNNTFASDNVTSGYGVLVSNHAGTPISIVITSNTFTQFNIAIKAAARFVTVVGNNNNNSENAWGWVDGGCTDLVIIGNQRN